MNNSPNNEMNNNNNNNNYDDDVVDLRELFNVIWEKKHYVVVVTSIFALISILYALRLPNIYQSEALMMPLEENGGMSGITSQLGGMASLAGISLSSDGGSKSQEAITRIQSFEFFSSHFLPLIKLENLTAAKRWNQADNTIDYDANVFSPETGQWALKDNSLKSMAPSSQEAYEVYEGIMNISEDKKTLYVSLSIEHKSPFIAKKWVDLIIKKIDKVMRDEDKQDAMKSVQYLNSIVPTINYEAIKTALSSLQQEQMKRLMMVEANENYIFKVLDSPIVPEERSKPSRSIVVIIATILGGLISIIAITTSHYFRKSST
jgi:hypothetical protein